MKYVAFVFSLQQNVFQIYQELICRIKICGISLFGATVEHSDIVRALS